MADGTPDEKASCARQAAERRTRASKHKRKRSASRARRTGVCVTARALIAWQLGARRPVVAAARRAPPAPVSGAGGGGARSSMVAHNARRAARRARRCAARRLVRTRGTTPRQGWLAAEQAARCCFLRLSPSSCESANERRRTALFSLSSARASRLRALACHVVLSSPRFPSACARPVRFPQPRAGRHHAPP